MNEAKSGYNAGRLLEYSRETERTRGAFDLPFALLILLLLTIGVIMVLSASFASAYYDLERETGGSATYYFRKQLIFALMGVGLMYGASLFPAGFYRRMSFPLLLVSIGLLVLVLIVGDDRLGAKRWINLGFTTFQPSEIAKLSVIMMFSAMICRYKKRMQTIRYGILPFVAILGVIVGLLLPEPHLSASLIIIMIGAVMMFLGGVRLYWFLIGGGVVAVAGVFVVTQFAHAISRISVWLNPMEDTTGDGWQIIQSIYAIGSGGLLGQGLGQSRQKYLYLPEEHNDFIFAVVCEELGFIGATLILILFALLIMRGYWLALHTKDRYSFLLCAGITTLLALQVILNVAVVTNLVPCTGISLPFFSYGGTALLIQMVEMGIVLSISRDIPGRKSG